MLYLLDIITYKPSQDQDIPYICHITAENGKARNEEDKKVLETMKILASRHGARIWARGRNPDRKSVVQQTGRSHASLRRSIPLEYSTEFSLYLRNGDANLLKTLREIAKTFAATK